MDFQLYVTFGVALFSIVDSVGNIPLFVAATDGFTTQARRWIIERASLVATLVLLFFLLAGQAILNILNIRLSSFKIAAGIVLFIIGWDLLRARVSSTKTTKDEQDEALVKEDIAVFPLAIPLLSGPGAITTCMVYATHVHGPFGKILLAVVVAIVMALSFVVLEAGSIILARIGLTGMRVFRRIMGLLLTAIAVNFVVEGVKETIPYIAG